MYVSQAMAAMAYHSQEETKMKTFLNHDVEISTGKTNDYELMLTCLNNMPQGGFSPEEMHSRLRVVDVIKVDQEEGGTDSIELEDADAKVLQRCVEAMRWGVLDRGLLLFVERVRKADG